MILLLCGFLAFGPPTAQAGDHPVSFAAASASSAPGAWATVVQGGWPWSGLRAQVGLAPRLTLVGEVDTAIFRRIQPSAGLAVLLLGTDKGRLSVELGLGGQVQLGELAHRGPSAALRLRLVAAPGPVGPFLVVGTRHTLLFHRTTTLRLDADEPDISVRTEHRWSPWFQLGLAFAPSRHLGFELAIDWHFVDVGVVAVTLPGFHFGLHVGNPGPRREGS